MRKKNPLIRWHLTSEEIRTIRKLTKQRIPQATIARIMSIGRDTVSKWQLRLGLPTRVPVPESKILELFEKGWGGVRIAKHLHVGVSAVYKVMHEHSFRRQDGAGSPEPKGNVAGFIEALKRREDYVIRLARKYGIAICRAQRLAHEVLGTYRFRPGVSKPALSSDFPQRHFDLPLAQHQQEEALAAIVRNAIRAFGRLPEDLAGLNQLVTVCISVAALIFKRERPAVYLGHFDQERIVDFFMPRFLQATTTLRVTQTGWTN